LNNRKHGNVGFETLDINELPWAHFHGDHFVIRILQVSTKFSFFWCLIRACHCVIHYFSWPILGICMIMNSLHNV